MIKISKHYRKLYLQLRFIIIIKQLVKYIVKIDKLKGIGCIFNAFC